MLKDSKAVSPVVGFILLLQILIIFLAFVQTTIVPDQLKKIEYDNIRSLRSEMAKFSALLSSGSDAYLMVKTPEYPDYLFLLTPEPAGFSIWTEPFKINVSANIVLPNGSKMNFTKSYETRRIYIQMNNYFYPDTTFIFENTAVFQKNNGGYGVAGEQNIVKGGLNAVIIHSNISEAYNSPREFSFKTVSSGGRYYAENISIEFKSVNPEYWQNAGFSVTEDIVRNSILNGTFSISLISDVEKRFAPEYIIKTNPFDTYSFSAGDSREFGVVVLDKFLNPLPGIRVNVSVTGGIGSISPQSVDTDSSGLARVTFLATSSGNGEIVFSIGNLSARYNVSVIQPQTGNRTSLVQVNWLNSSGFWDVGIEGGRKILFVEVTDNQSNPIPGMEVRFSVTNSSVISLNATTALTDSNGIARVQASALSNGSVRIFAFAGDAGDFIDYDIGNITWRYTRPIYIEERSGTDLTNYIVRIDLDSTNFDFSKANSDGSDVRFKYGNSILDYWIERWDSSNNQATVWVKIPSIPANTNITIYMIYGNPSATSMSSIENTFAIVGEAGKTDVNGNEKTVTFNHTFSDPIVFAVPVVPAGVYRSGENTAQHHIITSVSTTGFTVKQVESLLGDGFIDTTQINYIALERGRYYIGTNMLAEVSTLTARGSYRTVSFQTSFPSIPSILSDPQEAFGSLETIYSRIRYPTSSSFQLQIESDDDSTPFYISGVSTGYAAIQQGFDPVNNLESRKTGRSISDQFGSLSFSNIYSAPPVVIAQQVSEYGWNPAYAVVRSITQSFFEVAVEESARYDGPHTTEEISWISVPDGFIYGRYYVNPEPKVTVGNEI